MTDDWDRRLLMTILADFYNQDIVVKSRYTFSPSGKYFAPSKSIYEDYVEFIKVIRCVRLKVFDSTCFNGAVCRILRHLAARTWQWNIILYIISMFKLVYNPMKITI